MRPIQDDIQRILPVVLSIYFNPFQSRVVKIIAKHTDVLLIDVRDQFPRCLGVILSIVFLGSLGFVQVLQARVTIPQPLLDMREVLVQALETAYKIDPGSLAAGLT